MHDRLIISLAASHSRVDTNAYSMYHTSASDFTVLF